MAKVLPEAKHFPCETKHCPHFHSNLSGYCEQCTRESSLLPPGIKKRVRRAGRQAQLFLITLVMSYLETDDKILLAGFGGSVALICVLYVMTWCVAPPADGLRWAALAVVMLAIGLAAYGYSPIMSEDECSASEVGNMVSRTYTGSFCNSQLGPKGCAMNTGSPEIWFMNCDADTDASWHAPVCKRDWGPPSPAPTTP